MVNWYGWSLRVQLSVREAGGFDFGSFKTVTRGCGQLRQFQVDVLKEVLAAPYDSQSQTPGLVVLVLYIR